jgi:hypothetical protein
MFLLKILNNSNENSKRKLIISTQSVMCSTSFVSVYWSWNTHMCQVVCNPGMNFMKVHAFLLKGWFSSLNTLCELVSNRNSSSPYAMILKRKAWQQGIMAGSFAINLMSTKNVFYIVKGFWAYQKGNDGQTKMQSF